MPARRWENPWRLERQTDRYFGQVQGDPELYRNRQEVLHLKQQDPIVRLRQKLLEQGWLTPEQDAEIQRTANAKVAEAIEFARQSPSPAPEEALEDVFVPVG